MNAPVEQVILTDQSSGATAKVLVGFGFNCYSFQPIVGGQPHEVLWSAANFSSGQERPSHSGIPILFPYPGRLRGKTLTWRGNEFPLEGDDGRGNAIHGYVLNRPWRVVEQQPARLAGEFTASRDEPELLKKWPSDFRIRASYDITGGRLANEITIENTGSESLPFGLGTHAYFRLPLGAGGRVDDCLVTVPVDRYWELVDMLPTGRTLPAEGDRGLAGGMDFAHTKLDDVFTGVKFDADGWATATITDRAAGRRLTLRFDSAYRQCVVYNPPHREAICIEPYTCLPDSYEMSQRGLDTGLHVLEPGDQFIARSVVELV